MSQKTSRNMQLIAVGVLAIVVIGVGLGAYILISTAPPASGPPSKIIVGWTESDTGPLAVQTPSFNIYYRWIIEDYNKTGGLYLPQYGVKVPFGNPIIYDDASDINTMITEYTKLITEDHVNLLFGPVSTALNYALFPLCELYKMPVVAITFGSDIAGAKMRSGQFSYAFSVLGFPGESADQIVELFKYINTTVSPNGLTKVGVLADNDQHGVEYGAAMFADLVLNGFSVPVYTSYPAFSGAAAFAPMIASLNASNVDAVIVTGYEGPAFETECSVLNYNPKLIVCGPGIEVGWLDYGPLGFTPSTLNGTMMYDGWPSSGYNSGDLTAWAQEHYNRTATDPPYNFPTFAFNWWPYPASATFYAGLQCLFEAVQTVGLDGTAIRNALASDTFTTILGQTHLIQGSSLQSTLTGTVNQWQGGNMPEVVWPLSVASAPVIYPRPQYP